MQCMGFCMHARLLTSFQNLPPTLLLGFMCGWPQGAAPGQLQVAAAARQQQQQAVRRQHQTGQASW